MNERFERFYSTFGDRGVMFILFAFSVVIHALFTISMELPAVYPDEFSAAGITAYYVGKDWSGVMSSAEGCLGYIQALFYIPLALVFGSPYALYKAMLVMNGVLISFIPMIAYHLAAKIGVPKVWQKVTISLCCGFYITYVAHSKAIWNEAVTGLLPWLIVWCVFMAWDRKNKYSRFTFSVITGFLCAVCYAAHPRLIAVVAALILTLIIARAVFKEKILNLPSFFITLAVSFVTEYFCGETINKSVFGDISINLGEIRSGLINIEVSGANGFLAAMSGHNYTFFTSTLGMGAMAAAVFVIICAKRGYEWYQHRKRPLENGTKVYEPIKHKYSLRITFFGIYSAIAIVGLTVISVLYQCGSGALYAEKQSLVFGQFIDSAAPMAVFLVLTFIFLYGYSVKLVASTAGIYAYVCLCFALISYPLVEKGGDYRATPILGLLPWRIGENFTESFSPITFIIMSSMVFGMLALMAVFASCTKRFRAQLAAIAASGVFLYTTFFAGAVYLPKLAEQNALLTAPAKEISEFIYNEAQSPKIVAYNLDRQTAGIIQFLNPDTKVVNVNTKAMLPETGVAVFENGSEVPFYPEQYDVIGSTEKHTVLAYGDAARDYIRYKNTKPISN